jgi:twitching motility protein PilT
VVDTINRREARHIVVIDDPMEFEHVHGRSLVEHFEVGTDTSDVATAIRSARRIGADVIVVGQLAAADARQAALLAAASGALVIVTFPAVSLDLAVAAMVAAYPEPEQAAARQMVASTLAAALVITLVPTSQGSRRAYELLMCGPTVRRAIAAQGAIGLRRVCAGSRSQGSFTLEDSIGVLLERGQIGRDEAERYSPPPAELG